MIDYSKYDGFLAGTAALETFKASLTIGTIEAMVTSFEGIKVMESSIVPSDELWVMKNGEVVKMFKFVNK